jgi:hypothetical protein
VKRYRAQRRAAREIRTSGGLRSQAAERVNKAFQGGKAKEIRKHKAGAAKPAAFTTTIGAWMVRLIGGGGGI